MFARNVFFGAGVYGLLVLLPQYFLEAKNGLDYPPAITHPEYYYGFIGVALVWQIVFFLIARDPVRLRLLMIPSVFEKLVFAIPVFIMYAMGRVAVPMTLAAGIDFGLGILFAIAFIQTRPRLVEA